MYNHFQLAKKYLRYFFTASNGKGHGIHSPFVFDLVKNVLNDKKEYDCYAMIEQQRNALKKEEAVIEIEDFGAGSSVVKSNRRVVKEIAHSSLKPAKYAQLLFRLVQYYQPQTMLELGTSLGITSAYLSCGNEKGHLFTCEGSSSIAAIAKNNFNRLRRKNIELVQGDFAQTLPPLLASMPTVDFAFLDGNHRKAPTVQYFRQLLNHTQQHTIFVFDDIHWSAEMEEAWTIIKADPSVTLTIDLFFIGLVFINPDFKVPQHFTIRF